MLKPVLQNPWVQMVALLLGLGLLALFAYLLSPILIPLGFALLAAYVLDPVVNFCERWGIRRQLAISALAMVALIIVLCVPMFLVPSVISQAEALIRADAERAAVHAGGIRGDLSTWFDDRIADPLVKELGWGPEGISADAFSLEPPFWTPIETKPYSARVVLAKKIGELIKSNALDVITSHGATVASASQQAGWVAARFFAAVGSSVVSVFLFLADFALFAFVAGYMLKDFPSIESTALELVPLKYREKTIDIMRKIDHQLRGFLRGQLTVCCCLGVMYMAGLLMAGTPFAVPIAVFGAVASFVPYMGITLTIVPSLLLSLLQHGADGHVLGVLMTFIVAHSIESMILTPKIMGEHVGLSPVWVILAIMVFGSALGFLGLLLAVPIAATLKVLVLEVVAYYKHSRAFVGEDAVILETEPTLPAPESKPAPRRSSRGGRTTSK